MDSLRAKGADRGPICGGGGKLRARRVHTRPQPGGGVLQTTVPPHGSKAPVAWDPSARDPERTSKVPRSTSGPRGKLLTSHITSLQRCHTFHCQVLRKDEDELEDYSAVKVLSNLY